MKNEHDPIYLESDVEDSEDFMRAQLVKLFVAENITFGKFSQLHREYMTRLGEHPDKIASDRNNRIKTITKKKHLTYSMFVSIVKDILGFNLNSMTMRLTNREGKVYILSVDRLTY